MELIVREELLFLVPALWCLGYWLKSTPNVKDWVIPYILCLFSVTGAIATCGLTVDAVANGIIAVGVAVLGNQVLRQTSKGIKEGKKEV